VDTYNKERVRFMCLRKIFLLAFTVDVLSWTEDREMPVTQDRRAQSRTKSSPSNRWS